MLEQPKASATNWDSENAEDVTMANQQVTLIAWFAGILDGEGTVGFNVSTEKRKGKGKKQFLPWVQIVNTNWLMLEKCKTVCDSVGIGYNVCFPKKPKGNRKPHWLFCLAGAKRVGALLPLVIPYLTDKKMCAENVMAFIRSRKGKEFKANTDRAYTPDEIHLVQATRRGSSETTREALPDRQMKI